MAKIDKPTAVLIAAILLAIACAGGAVWFICRSRHGPLCRGDLFRRQRRFARQSRGMEKISGRGPAAKDIGQAKAVYKQSVYKQSDLFLFVCGTPMVVFMKNPFLHMTFFFLFFQVAQANAGDVPNYIQTFSTGVVDWSRGVVQAKGEAAAGDISVIEKPTRSALLDEAVEKARSNLLETVYQVRVDAATLLGEVAAGNETLKKNIVGIIGEAEPVVEEIQEDWTADAVVELPFSGGFSQLVLPDRITRLQSITPMPSEKDKPSGLVSKSNAGVTADEKPATSHTGLVIDAKGLKVLPALSPRILDEKGEQVYGASYASREYAVQIGVCGYMKSLDAAAAHERVAGNPLVVKGLRTNGPALSDIVISDKDALKIRGASENLTFLKKCRVIVVLD